MGCWGSLGGSDGFRELLMRRRVERLECWISEGVAIEELNFIIDCSFYLSIKTVEDNQVIEMISSELS